MRKKTCYINPLTDFGFKRIFGSEPNKDLLIDFLNQLLPAIQQIKDIKYKVTENIGEIEEDRSAIFDIACEGMNGESFIIEMQNARQLYFKDRSLFYTTFPLRQQAPKGKWDFNLASVFTICILDFCFPDEISKKKKKITRKIYLKDQDGDLFYEKLGLFFIELPNFEKKEEELETKWEKWLFVLKNLSRLEDRPEVLHEGVFQKLFEAAKIANFTPQERQEYEESMKRYRNLDNIKMTYRLEGKKEVLQLLEKEKEKNKHFQAQIKNERQKAAREKRKAKRDKLAAARAVKQEGMSLNKIAKYFGLTLEEVRKL